MSKMVEMNVGDIPVEFRDWLWEQSVTGAGPKVALLPVGLGRREHAAMTRLLREAWCDGFVTGTLTVVGEMEKLDS